MATHLQPGLKHLLQRANGYLKWHEAYNWEWRNEIRYEAVTRASTYQCSPARTKRRQSFWAQQPAQVKDCPFRPFQTFLECPIIDIPLTLCKR